MLSEIREHSGSHSGLPDVELASAVAEEDDELSVRRDLGAAFLLPADQVANVFAVVGVAPGIDLGLDPVVLPVG